MKLSLKPAKIMSALLEIKYVLESRRGKEGAKNRKGEGRKEEENAF